MSQTMYRAFTFAIISIIYCVLMSKSEASGQGESIDLNFVKVPNVDFLFTQIVVTEDKLLTKSKGINISIKNPFWISDSEITQEQWTRVMGHNPSSIKAPQFPVVNITWQDAVSFCEKISILHGKKYRLPSESEWIWACIGCNKNYVFNQSEIGRYAWTLENSFKVLHRVKTARPNKLGLYDMQGNVAEWCSDRYTDENNERAKDLRVVKGGATCWTVAGSNPLWKTGFEEASYSATFIGFRIVTEEL